MRTDLFDFELPDDLIALHPASPRDAARLLVVRPGDGLADAWVRNLSDLLQPGDALVVNDTRVIMAELEGIRTREDGSVARIHANLLQRLDDSRWLALARPAKRLKEGSSQRRASGSPNQSAKILQTKAGESKRELPTGTSLNR